MSETPQAFIDHSRKLMTADYLPRIESCLETLTDQNIWWRPNAESNSIGNLILHLAGNVRQWLVSGIGGASDNRERHTEFEERGPIPQTELVSLLRTTVEDADRTLSSLDPGILDERRKIQGCEVTCLEAIYHAVEHFSMHTGQIIVLTKMWSGDLAFYEVKDGVARPNWNLKRADSGEQEQ